MATAPRGSLALRPRLEGLKAAAPRCRAAREEGGMRRRRRVRGGYCRAVQLLVDCKSSVAGAIDGVDGAGVPVVIVQCITLYKCADMTQPFKA